jgi:hypothetical protein
VGVINAPVQTPPSGPASSSGLGKEVNMEEVALIMLLLLLILRVT